MMWNNQERPKCSVCKHKGVSCPPYCFYARYFPPESPTADQEFADVNRYYGTNNFKSHIIQAGGIEYDPVLRKNAADTLKCEANARRRNPVFGVTAIVKSLEDQLRDAEGRLKIAIATNNRWREIVLANQCENAKESELSDEKIEEFVQSIIQEPDLKRQRVDETGEFSGSAADGYKG